MQSTDLDDRSPVPEVNSQKPPIPDQAGNADAIRPDNVSAKFETLDRGTIVFLAFTLIIACASFFAFVRAQGLLSFDLDPKSVVNDYFGQALELRERRLTLILTYRTFLSGLGFTVGLVLSALGGLFILRRAQMNFDFRASGSASNLENAKVGLIMNSPGVAFMIGGVTIMIATQWLALPVGAPEIFPSNALPVCSELQKQAGTCHAGVGTRPVVDLPKNEDMSSVAVIEAFCKIQLEDSRCIAFNELKGALVK